MGPLSGEATREERAEFRTEKYVMSSRNDENVSGTFNLGGLNTEMSNSDESSSHPWATQASLNSAFLPYVDPRELHRRISAFRMLNFSSLSYDDVLMAINRVIMFDTARGPMSVLAPTMAQYPAGTNFYRVRNHSRERSRTPLEINVKDGRLLGASARGRTNWQTEPGARTAPVHRNKHANCH